MWKLQILSNVTTMLRLKTPSSAICLFPQFASDDIIFMTTFLPSFLISITLGLLSEKDLAIGFKVLTIQFF